MTSIQEQAQIGGLLPRDAVIETLARLALQEAAQREAVLWGMLVSGAFANELVLVWQPSTGRWWVQ